MNFRMFVLAVALLLLPASACSDSEPGKASIPNVKETAGSVSDSTPFSFKCPTADDISAAFKSRYIESSGYANGVLENGQINCSFNESGSYGNTVNVWYWDLGATYSGGIRVMVQPADVVTGIGDYPYRSADEYIRFPIINTWIGTSTIQIRLENPSKRDADAQHGRFEEFFEMEKLLMKDLIAS